MRLTTFATLLTLAIFWGFALGCPLKAADCDGSFTLDATHTSVLFNNQSKACYNWQVSYFSAGFSAVSVQFESAPNGANSNVPGTFVAFAGQVLSGINPNTSLATSTTSTFAGSFPWVRVRLVSSTGTGQVNGRMLGAQLTSAAIGFSGASEIFGTLYPPNANTFTQVDPGTAVFSVAADGSGVFWGSPNGSADTTLMKLCAPLPAPPWSVTAAFLGPVNTNQVGFMFGLDMHQTGGTRVEEFVQFQPQNIVRNIWQCTGTTLATCATFVTLTSAGGAQNPIWERVVDDGITRDWQTSSDGRTFGRIMGNFVATGATYANIVPNQGCFVVEQPNNDVPISAKIISWRVCPNTTGVC